MRRRKGSGARLVGVRSKPKRRERGEALRRGLGRGTTASFISFRSPVGERNGTHGGEMGGEVEAHSSFYDLRGLAETVAEERDEEVRRELVPEFGGVVPTDRKSVV